MVPGCGSGQGCWVHMFMRLLTCVCSTWLLGVVLGTIAQLLFDTFKHNIIIILLLLYM